MGLTVVSAGHPFEFDDGGIGHLICIEILEKLIFF